MIHFRQALLLLLLLPGSACTQSAQTSVSLELFARGNPVSRTLDDGTALSLSRAELAFGPFYLCAGAQAGQSCDTALAEWRGSQVVDLLQSTPVSLGQLEGYSGRALSYMHDCGFVSLLTQEEPLVLDAAEELAGHSVVIEGLAVVPIDGTPPLPFRMTLRITSSQNADRGLPVVRSSPGQFDASLDAQSASLTVAFDAAEWLGELDGSAFWQYADCEAGSSDFVCAGTVSQDCSADSAVDCSTSSQICAPDRGCQDAIVLDDDSPAGRAVAQAITLAIGQEIRIE